MQKSRVVIIIAFVFCGNLFAMQKQINQQKQDALVETIKSIDQPNARLKIINFLLGAEVNINVPGKNGHCALHRAVDIFNIYPDILKGLLLLPNIDVNKKNENGKTPLLFAQEYNLDEAYSLILQDPRCCLALYENREAVRSFIARKKDQSIIELHGNNKELDSLQLSRTRLDTTCDCISCNKRQKKEQKSIYHEKTDFIVHNGQMFVDFVNLFILNRQDLYPYDINELVWIQHVYKQDRTVIKNALIHQAVGFPAIMKKLLTCDSIDVNKKNGSNNKPYATALWLALNGARILDDENFITAQILLNDKRVCRDLAYVQKDLIIDYISGINKPSALEIMVWYKNKANELSNEDKIILKNRGIDFDRLEKDLSRMCPCIAHLPQQRVNLYNLQQQNSMSDVEFAT